METLNGTPTLTEKQEVTNFFKHYFNRTKESYKLANWTSYKFGLSHDGITLWNESSNSIGFEELLLIKDFCDNSGYSFSCFTRKTTNVSGYGGVCVEINICR